MPTTNHAASPDRRRGGLRALTLGASLVLTAGLAGCAPQTSGGPDTIPTELATQSQAPATAIAEGGAAIGNVSVLGETWREPTVTIGDVSKLGDQVERSIIAGGGAAPLEPSSKIVANLVIYDASTKTAMQPYGPLGQVISLDDAALPDYLRELFIGVPSGSRIAALIPGSVLADGQPNAAGMESPAALVVADIQSLDRMAAWGAPQTPTQTLVALGPSGADGSLGSVTIDASQPAPTELVKDTVLLGDGPVVLNGQTVTVQYEGRLFPSGTAFDSSWTRGAPAQFSTTKVVPGFAQALVGSTVGSRVIAVLPPSLGYGDQASGSIPAGSTLVFVIDILDAK